MSDTDQMQSDHTRPGPNGRGLASLGGLPYFPPMSLQELESEVTRLSKPDLAAFYQWFEEFVAEAWDKQMEADVDAGKLDSLARQADAQFEAGRCTPL
jgi:hypothetical protein